MDIGHIVKCLEIASDSPLVDGEDRLKASGRHLKITQPVFRFLVNFLADLLDTIEPVNKMLQSREIAYSAVMPLINSCIEKIKLMRNEEVFSEYEKAGETLIHEEEPVAARRVIYNFLHYSRIFANSFLCMHSCTYIYSVNSSMLIKLKTFE